MKKISLLLTLLASAAFGQGMGDPTPSLITGSKTFSSTTTFANGLNITGGSLGVGGSMVCSSSTGACTVAALNGTATVTLHSQRSDAAAAVNLLSDNQVGAFANATARLMVLQNGTVDKYQVDLNGFPASIGTIAGTGGSGTGITINNTGTNGYFVHSITVAENALTAAATTQDITLWTLPAQTRLIRVVARSTAGFTGGALTNMQVMCGPTAGTATYLVNGSIFSTNVLGDAAAEIGTALTSATVADIPSMSATSTIICRFTGTTDNVVNATAGSVTFWIEGVVYK